MGSDSTRAAAMSKQFMQRLNLEFWTFSRNLSFENALNAARVGHMTMRCLFWEEKMMERRFYGRINLGVLDLEEKEEGGNKPLHKR